MTLDLAQPGQVYPDRLNTVDMRFTKIIRIGRTRTNVGVDLYNLFNANTGTSFNQNFGTDGSTWLRPNAILNPRYVRFNATVDFLIWEGSTGEIRSSGGPDRVPSNRSTSSSSQRCVRIHSGLRRVPSKICGAAHGMIGPLYGSSDDLVNPLPQANRVRIAVLGARTRARAIQSQPAKGAARRGISKGEPLGWFPQKNGSVDSHGRPEWLWQQPH